MRAPPEREGVKHHRHALRDAESGGSGESLVTLLAMRNLQERIVRVVHAVFEAERLHLANHRRRLRDERRAPSHRLAHDGVARGDVLHVDHLADGKDGNCGEEHKSVFPARRHRKGETEDERAERLHRRAEGFSCGALHERGVRPKVGGERADRVLRIVEIRNLLAEDGAKQMHAKSRGESLADDGEHAALRAADDPGRGGDADEDAGEDVPVLHDVVRVRGVE